MYSDKYKKILLKILKNDLKLTKEQILIFLNVSESTYNKMISSTNRALPQKSQYFIEHIYKTSDWKEIITSIKNNNEFVYQVIKIREVKNKFTMEQLLKNSELLLAILNNDSIQNLSKNDMNILINLLDNNCFKTKLNSLLTIHKFINSGNESNLTYNDIYNIGAKSIEINNDELSEMIYDEGRKKIKEIKRSIDFNQLI